MGSLELEVGGFHAPRVRLLKALCSLWKLYWRLLAPTNYPHLKVSELWLLTSRAAVHEALFIKYDSNKDGVLDKKEAGEARSWQPLISLCHAGMTSYTAHEAQGARLKKELQPARPDRELRQERVRLHCP